MTLKSKQTSYGLVTLEETGGGYGIFVNGNLMKGPFSNLDDAIRSFERDYN